MLKEVDQGCANQAERISHVILLWREETWDIPVTDIVK